MGEVGIDSRWDKFAIFHQYLSQAFPRVSVARSQSMSDWLTKIVFFAYCSHESSQLTKVNTYGLLYVWEGSNKSLKPILLNAHQGVYRCPVTMLSFYCDLKVCLPLLINCRRRPGSTRDL